MEGSQHESYAVGKGIPLACREEGVDGKGHRTGRIGRYQRHLSCRSRSLCPREREWHRGHREKSQGNDGVGGPGIGGPVARLFRRDLEASASSCADLPGCTGHLPTRRRCICARSCQAMMILHRPAIGLAVSIPLLVLTRASHTQIQRHSFVMCEFLSLFAWFFVFS